MIKKVAVGADSSFEQSFSSIAHAYLRERAPSLLDYEVGFQLLDRSDDDDRAVKAVGLFGFNVDEQWLYVPVFFLNGQLKGHELLYVKDNSSFVPSKEGWVQYILNRRPVVLGKSVSRNSASLGVQPPDLRALRTPMRKFSAWSQEALPTIAMATRLAPNTPPPDLPSFLKQAGAPAVQMLLKECIANPQLALAVDKMYGVDMLRKAAASCIGNNTTSGRVQTVRPLPKQADVRIITRERMADEVLPINELDREQIHRNGYLILDKRAEDEVSTAYKPDLDAKTTTTRLTSPNRTGVYDVLLGSGEFQKMLVIVKPVGGPVPYGSDAVAGDELVLATLEGPKAVRCCDISQVTCVPPEDENKWFDELTDSTPKVGGTYVAVQKNGYGSAPFRVCQEHGDSDGKFYSVYSYINDCHSDRPGYRLPPTLLRHFYDDDMSHSFTDSIKTVRQTSRAGHKIFLTSTESELRVPADAKFVRVDSDSSESDGKIVLGSGNDVIRALLSKTADLKLYSTGDEIAINSEHMPTGRAVMHLVTVHGLREKVAAQLVKEAKHNRSVRFRVKYAEGYPQEGNFGPAMPPPQMGYEPNYAGIPTQYSSYDQVPIEGVQQGHADPDVYEYDPNAGPDQGAIGAAIQASNAGQKEVFDTAMIGSLLKPMRTDSMIDRDLGIGMKGLNWLGETLFKFYWHRDAFADRYGKQDMPELEDTLRNAFDAVGDVILFLKQKTVDPYDVAHASGIELDDLSN